MYKKALSFMLSLIVSVSIMTTAVGVSTSNKADARSLAIKAIEKAASVHMLDMQCASMLLAKEDPAVKEALASANAVTTRVIAENGEGVPRLFYYTMDDKVHQNEINRALSALRKAYRAAMEREITNVIRIKHRTEMMMEMRAREAQQKNKS